MRDNLRTAAAAACLLAAALNLSTLAEARPGERAAGECMPSPADGPGGPGLPPGPPMEHGGPHFGPGGPGGPGWGGMAGGPMPPWLHQLRLSEEQQDSVFAILHEQEPTMRKHFKAVRSSREALHRASLSVAADPAQLRALADAAGRADADVAALMALTDQRLLQILTPAQQKSLQDCLSR